MIKAGPNRKVDKVAKLPQLNWTLHLISGSELLIHDSLQKTAAYIKIKEQFGIIRYVCTVYSVISLKVQGLILNLVIQHFSY